MPQWFTTCIYNGLFLKKIHNEDTIQGIKDIETLTWDIVDKFMMLIAMW